MRKVIANVKNLLSSRATLDNPKSEPINSFINPIIDQDFPDPSILRCSDGYFYLYGTQHRSDTYFRNIQVARSKNLIDWEILEDALPTKPDWANETHNFWAPDVKEVDGVFYMYFSAELNGTNGDMAIGVAISDNPYGPFHDCGKPLVTGHWIENIDPMAFDDPVTGKKLLYWGSGFKPIRVQELNDDRISFKEGSKPHKVLFPDAKLECETLTEGAYVTYKEGYYYMYYSGDCCWWDRKYAVMVARSKSALGPFEKMCKELHCDDDIIIGFSEHWKAPGHNCIVTDDNGQDWIIYHGVHKESRFEPGTEKLRRIVLMDKIEYRHGWPKVLYGRTNAHPQVRPYIK
jgi:arabinan endo-1,5-alpha-L-arabinosidase